MITWHPPWKQATLGGMPPQEYTQPGNKAFHWMAQGYVHCSTHWVKLCTGCERAQPKMVSYWQRAFDAQSLTLKPCEQREPQMLPRPAHLCQLTVQPTGKELVMPIHTALPPLATTRLQGIRCLAGLVTWVLQETLQTYGNRCTAKN